MSEASSSGFDIHQDRASYVRGGVIPCLVLAILSTFLRFYARYLQGGRIIASDILVVAALISGICIGAMVFAGIRYGFGRHVKTVSSGDLETFLKLFFAAELFYVSTITLAKMAVLTLYCNIFPGKRFALAAKIIGGIVLAWATACVFGVIFSCVPVSAFWDQSLRPHATCINSTKFFIGNAIPNMVTDAAILVLPMRNIWLLHMPWQKRAMVSGLFLLGSFVIVASILRLALLFGEDLNDPTYGLVNAFTWSNIEVDIAILSANLPTLRPVFQRVWPTELFSSFNTADLAPSKPSGPHSGNGRSVASDARLLQELSGQNGGTSHFSVTAGKTKGSSVSESMASTQMGSEETEELGTGKRDGTGEGQGQGKDNVIFVRRDFELRREA